MPIYRCPACGRTAELPEGNYYCRVCGPSAVMVKRGEAKRGASMVHGEAIKIPKHHINSDKKTLCEVKRENLIITEVCGKPVRVVLLPDWTLLYVEFTSKEEMQTLRRALVREEDVRLVKVTEKRIYFEQE